MSMIAVLNQCNRQGIKVRLKDGKLVVAAKGKVPAEIAAQLKLYKQDIIEFLSAQAEQVERTDVTIPALDASQPQVLSFAQQRLWFVQRFMGASSVYNIAMAFRLQGNLQLPALTKAVNALVARHHSLRTRFIEENEQPLQVVHPAESIDLTAESVANETELRTMYFAERDYCFDLANESLFRVRLAQEAKQATTNSEHGERVQQHVLFLTMHHIISDGWSIDVLFKELHQLYSAFCADADNPLLPLPIQYADYAAWQREQMQSEQWQRQLNYWLKQLDDLPPSLELPSDFPRPMRQTFRGGTHNISLSRALTQDLNRLSQHTGNTLFMTVLAAFSLLMSRYSGQSDLAVGIPVANRGHQQTTDLIGFFVNNLVIRSDLSSNPRFDEFLKATRNTALTAYDNPDVPFEYLVEKLNPERNLRHAPLFQVMLSMQTANDINDTSDSSTLLGDLAVSAVEFAQAETGARYDLTINLAETREGINGSIEFNRDLFTSDTVARMAMHFERLLQAVVANPERPVLEYLYLSEAEVTEQQHTWNPIWAPSSNSNETALVSGANSIQPHSQLCIHQLFERQAAQTPNNVALSFAGETLSYAAFNERANQVAHWLHNQGVQPDDRIGLCFQPSIDMMVALLGVLKAGGAYVGLLPAYPDERIDFIVQDASINIVLGHNDTQARHTALVSETALTVKNVTWLNVADSAELAELPTSNVTQFAHGKALSLANLAYVIYTSGSTGKPKGVLVNHGNVTRLLAVNEANFQFSASDTWSLFHSIAFDFSVWEMWGALFYGGKLAIVPFEIARSPNAFYDWLQQEKVTFLNQTPSMFKRIVDIDQQEHGDLALRAVVFGGEALDIQQLRPWFARHDDNTVQMVNMYGITETTVHVTYRRLFAADLEHPQNSLIGQKLDDLELYVLNAAQTMEPVGATAEVYVGGAGVTRGYLNRDELTARNFIAHPFKAGERLYRTGDLARFLSNGDLEYVGRVDHQVKVRGYRIELGEIEAKLTAHQLVTAALVIAQSYQGENHLIAYAVVPELNDESINPDTLRQFVAEQLPPYMVPSAFVLLPSFPLTVNGKIDRKALPAPDMAAQQQAFVAPEGEVEIALAAIWCEVLGLSLEEANAEETEAGLVGREANFFALGGHSLLATQLVSRVRRKKHPSMMSALVFESGRTTLFVSAEVLQRLVSAVRRCRQVEAAFCLDCQWLLSLLRSTISSFSISNSYLQIVSF